MRKSTTLAATFAIAVAVLTGLGGTAQAAIAIPFARGLTSAPSVTPVYWVWRHHHRYWVPDRRRDYRRY